MDPATARIALKLQLDDVDAILKTLPPSSDDAAAMGEVAAFRSLRNELVRKLHEVNGQCFAYKVLKEENNNRLAFKRLLSEELQAERDHDMACRLAGMPVPQRAPSLNKRAADSEGEADRKRGNINGLATGAKKPRIDLNGTQTAAAPAKSIPQPERPVEQQPASATDKEAATKSAMAGKQARVEDAPDDDEQPVTSVPSSPTAKKRVAFVDPAVLRENEDGRTKRPKTGTEDQNKSTDLDGAMRRNPGTSAPQTRQDPKTKDDRFSFRTCSSCLDQHPGRDMLQLACKDKGDSNTHAYCRDCLQRLFECSVTDPSHFPPRCCKKIIPAFSCIPFIPQALFARFVAKREELETPNRTYCSNAACSKWIRPSHIEANVATCTNCAHKTCTTCKNRHHDGLCPEDKSVKELMKVARRKRWQTCPNCKEMVELERGCYHITCRCRHQFCYLCQAKWHTCKCPKWDERNIIDRAQPVAVQPAPAPAPVPLPAPVLPQNLPAALIPNPFHGQAHAFNVPVALPNPIAVPTFARPFVNQHPFAFGNHAAPVQAPPPHPVNPVPGQVSFAGYGQPFGANVVQPHDEINYDICAEDGHDFERYYRSMGWDTTCNECGWKDRWVNCCSVCNLKACWYCTKHRI